MTEGIIHEKERLKKTGWKRWGSYVSDREWGTVREDYSADGNAWHYTTHDMARSYAWRWGEEAIGGICDEDQLLCFGWAFWNKRDPILKERLFGLGNAEGNHGEDVKELYYYLDATPTHSYMKMLYKYPMHAFPYQLLVEENARRGRQDPEYELLDTGIFDHQEYFDCFIEYAKADKDDILIRLVVFNRSAQQASLVVLPTVWFRNTWSWGRHPYKPGLQFTGDAIRISHNDLDMQWLYAETAGQPLFCDNESNLARLYNISDGNPYPKDGINNFIIHGTPAVNPQLRGTKAAFVQECVVPAGGSVTMRLRLCRQQQTAPFAGFDSLFTMRIGEADAFYAGRQSQISDTELKSLHRQAIAGMLWNKQFYSYKVQQWLDGDPSQPPPPKSREKGRNAHCTHIYNDDVVSVPDKWEFPWYAAWDLGFHCVTLALADPDFAKAQLLLLTQEWYMHPAGELPAYEWSLRDVNPPVHAGAVFRVFKLDARDKGVKDYAFLESLFHKLVINFTWWVNRKDKSGSNVFEGGFLGLDNIGVFDRSAAPPGGYLMEQADATSWMAMYSLNMLHISLELADYNKSYLGMATKFFEHFLYIAGAMAYMGKDSSGLWDEDDQFFYDQLRLPDGSIEKLKLRSMVGIIPLFAVEVITRKTLDTHPEFKERMDWFLNHRPDLASLVSRWNEAGNEEKHLLSLLRGHRMKKLLAGARRNRISQRLGVRSLSKVYDENPFTCILTVRTGGKICSGESDSNMYGGNSNWRGPVWLPMNFLIIESLRKFHFYYSDDFRIEYPTVRAYYSLKEVGRSWPGVCGSFCPSQRFSPGSRRSCPAAARPAFQRYHLF
ncbi:MAG: glucosidase [Flavihumibacter sp.]